jgi:hypothetical protein
LVKKQNKHRDRYPPKEEEGAKEQKYYLNKKYEFEQKN